MLYSVVLASATQQQESAVSIHISTPSWTFSPSLHPTPLGCYRAPGWAPCVTQQLPTSYFTYGSIYVLLLLFSHPPFPLLCPEVSSLCLHLYSCPANKFMSTIFLASIYMDYYTIFVFFWLTSLCVTVFRFIHLTETDSSSFLFMAE